MKIKILWALLVLSVPVAAQTDSRKMQFPDVPGYQTLLVDLHMHTVFSDGSVWPNIRVEEALLDGLDAIAITEHLEYQPHKQDIPHPNRNRAYQVAKDAAEESDLLIILGSEITRSMPPGHSNAVFLTDANALLKDDPWAVFQEATNQDAFVFWNHPHWTSQQPSGLASLTNMHRQLIEQHLLHGIEVVNDLTYSDEALQIALDNNLAIIGTSDIHGLVDWRYEVPRGGHRPVTLVFARERSVAGIKEGLENLRTVAWFENTLIGRPEQLIPLIKSTVTVGESEYLGKSSVALVEINNQSAVTFTIENRSPYGFYSDAHFVTIEPGQNFIEVKTVNRVDTFDLTFGVMNGLTAPKKHPEIVLQVIPK